MKSMRDAGLILLLTTTVLFFNLGRPRLWDRDEPRNAGCAREMLERGDWVVPVFNAELRTHKPVLLYWFMMSAYSVFGVNEFSARFWSAAFAMGTVYLTYLIGRRLLGRSAGLWSACCLASFMMFGVVGRAATPDSTLIFFATASIAVFVLSVWRRAESDDKGTKNSLGVLTESEGATLIQPFPSARWVSMFMYGLMALAVLAKGPVGLVLPTAVIGMFCLIERKRLADVTGGPTGWWGAAREFAGWFHPVHFLKTCWVMRPLTAIGMVALIAGPWYAWVGMRTEGAWLAGFLGEHNVGRALQPMEGHSGSTLFFYPIVLLACAFPWSVLTVPTVVASRRAATRAETRSAMVFLTCWVAVYVVLFSIARTKLPSYIAPAFPAVALLFGGYIDGLIRRGAEFDRRWAHIGMGTLAMVGILFAVGLNFATRRYLPRETSFGLVALIPITAGVVGMILLERKRTLLALQTLGLSAVAMSVVVFGILSVRVSQYQQYDAMLASLHRMDSEATLGSFGQLEPTWVFYSQRPIAFFSDARIEDAAEFVRIPNRYLVVTERRLEKLSQNAAVPLKVVARTKYFLKDETLLMVTAKHDALAKK